MDDKICIMVKNSDINIDELKEIEDELNKYKPFYKMYIRLLVVKLVKEGMTRGEAAERLNVHRKSAENWVKLYNEKGLKGLEPDYSNSGLNCKLSDEQLVELKNIVLNSGKDYDINSVRKLISDKYNVNYSYKQTWVILRNKLGLNYKNHILFE